MSSADTLIPVKTAVNSAVDYVREFGDLFPNPSRVRLEETEFDGSSEDWIITLSFEEVPFSNYRIYKQFRVNAHTGAVAAMKMKARE
jgi:hypothetical protein